MDEWPIHEVECTVLPGQTVRIDGMSRRLVCSGGEDGEEVVVDAPVRLLIAHLYGCRFCISFVTTDDVAGPHLPPPTKTVVEAADLFLSLAAADEEDLRATAGDAHNYQKSPVKAWHYDGQN